MERFGQFFVLGEGLLPERVYLEDACALADDSPVLHGTFWVLWFVGGDITDNGVENHRELTSGQLIVSTTSFIA